MLKVSSMNTNVVIIFFFNSVYGRWRILCPLRSKIYNRSFRAPFTMGYNYLWTAKPGYRLWSFCRKCWTKWLQIQRLSISSGKKRRSRVDRIQDNCQRVYVQAVFFGFCWETNLFRIWGNCGPIGIVFLSYAYVYGILQGWPNIINIY